MVDLQVHDVPEDVMARLRDRAEKTHRSVEGYVKYLLERDSQRLTTDELIERSRQISKGSGVTTDDILAALEEDRSRHA